MDLGTCKACGTALMAAPGIDIYCPNKACDHDQREAERVLREMRERQDDAERRRALWQPIETAPHNVEVLLADPGGRIRVGCASFGWRNEVASNISRDGQATHWMPLPEAPE